MGKNYKIAVLPGDGTGPEVVVEGKKALTAALGVLVVIDKQREIYFLDNVKFHVDTVKNLGNFIEIEAIGTDGNYTKEELLSQCEHYLQVFGINEDDLISVSYSDLLLAKHKK